MRDSQNIVRSEERDGFRVDARVTYESLGCVDYDTLVRIRMEELLFFSVTVTASRAGITFGSAFLGGCIYKEVDEFFADENGYYADLVQEAVEEAKNALKRLLDDCEREQKQIDAQEGEKW